MKTFRRKVLHGKKLGRKIGFPTVNFNVGSFARHFKQGVYTCEVRIGKKTWKGALHFGPKQGSRKPALEIHILNFKGNLYGKTITFRPLKFVRPPKTFASLDALKKQITRDLLALKC
jgi:riboflavin kinase/FMN adenylyltransferase